ncbi:hypothetical protein NL676_030008 [Syzygium grande]|nr:hypothetical protein NL676_030008 [Syzygium grande]
MAREARRREKMGPKRDDTGDGENGNRDDYGDDGEVIAESRTAMIEKEIGSRLDKLQKKLGPVRKSPGLSRKVPLEGASSLMFKKKLKFRSPLVEKPSANPKGFQGLQDNGKTKKKSSSEVNGEGQTGGLNHGVMESSNGEKWDELVDGKGHGSLSNDIKLEGDETMVFKEMRDDLHNDGVGEGQSFPQVDEEVGYTRSRTGIVEEASGKRNSIGEANLRTTGNSRLQSSRSFGDEKQQEVTKKIRWSRCKNFLAYLLFLCVEALIWKNQVDSLPLKTAPEDSDASSFTVAFEDRVDANNFCFLLESFFEELGDFSADIVPLLRKELQEAMKEKTMQMVVVRKGQLKLYAGQPFSDVELALQSLVEESPSE